MSTTDQTVKTPEPTEPATAPEGGGNGEAGGPTAAAPAELPNVYQAIAAVIADLPAIEKGDKAPESMGGYSFRGIERIMAAAQSKLAKHGVVFYGEQRLIGVDYEPKGWGNTDRMHRVMTETTWTIRGPRGDRVKPKPITMAMALDSTDKGLNKCATQAKKYMLMDLLQIADAASDTDGQVPDPGPERQPTTRPEETFIDAATVTKLAERIKALPESQRAELAATWVQENPMDGKPYLPLDPESGKPSVRQLKLTDVQAVEALCLRLEKAAKATPATPADRAKALAEKAAADAQPPAAAEPAQDAPGEPAAAADGEPAAETAQDDTAPAPETLPAPMIPSDWGDLAEKTDRQMVDMLAGLRRRVPADVVKRVEQYVAKNMKHPAHADAAVTAIEGQTVADGEPIDHRRMRVMASYLCGWLTVHPPAV